MEKHVDTLTCRLDGLQVLVTRETVDEPSQYWLQTHHKDGPPTERQLSDFPHPHPQLHGLKKEILRYKRSDGVDLTGDLHRLGSWFRCPYLCGPPRPPAALHSMSQVVHVKPAAAARLHCW